MSKKLSDNNEQLESSSSILTGYASAGDYYLDSLKKLDLMIQFQMNRNQVPPSDNPLDQFKGLMVTEDEVLSLLQDQSEIVEVQSVWNEEQHQLDEYEAMINQRLDLSPDIQIPLKQAAYRFNLSSQEEHCVFICLAVELDRKYEKIYGFLQDDITCKYPTVDLMLNLLCRTSEAKLRMRNSFAADSNLSKYFLRNDDETSHKGSILTKILRLDERMIAYLLSQSYDTNNAYYELIESEAALEELIIGHATQANLINFTKTSYDANQALLIYNLWGNSGTGKKLQVKHFCQALQKKLILADLRSLREKTQDYSVGLERIFREAALHNAVIAFQNYEIMLEEDEATRRVLYKINFEMKHFKGIIFLLTSKPWKTANYNRQQIFISIELEIPEAEQRKQLWTIFGAKYALKAEIDWGTMASKFKFSPGQIKQALIAANHYSKWKQQGDCSITSEELHKACYDQVKHKLENKATHIRPKRLWDEVILPPEQKELLRNACNQVKYRHVVYGEWGFENKLSYGKGVSMLFAGPPGTGKTMSAEVVAKELMLEIYKIDLSQVISKYIGETEKNLQEIFHEAQYSNAILFFDEADALFGKRSEVKDSHDKYANIETAYLLQKIEEYAGISILATNLSQNIDDAFMRRLNYVIKFPFPDAEYREKIWRSMFPVEAPQNEDIDYKFIAQRFEIAGGNIKNIVVSAAFLAAENQQSIGMKQIIQAARNELKKSGKLLLKEDLGEYDML